MVASKLQLSRGWDDTYRGFTDDLQLGRKLRKPQRAKRGPVSTWTGAPVRPRVPTPYTGYGSKADVYARLQGVAQRSRQVMVKITGGGKTTWSIRKHLAYISRDGELPMGDQNGNEIVGGDAVKDVAWRWIYEGPALLDDSRHKQAFNIIFSMPEGTDAQALHDAVRATAEHEFAGHQWVMVQHFDEPHVHAHVCVKAVGFDGQRLNPRKADLHRWRERFAYELRERGVDAEATRRVQRLERTKANKPWEATRLEERGLPTNPPPAAVDPARAAGWERNEAQASESYARLVAELAKSTATVDRELAKGLERTLEARSEQFRQRTRGPREPELVR